LPRMIAATLSAASACSVGAT